jgi:hypothetical protein
MQHIIPLAAEEIEKKILNIPDHWGEVADQTFDPESTNAQSGLAVAEALENTLQFTAQELDVDQQRQARENIGAASWDCVTDLETAVNNEFTKVNSDIAETKLIAEGAAEVAATQAAELTALKEDGGFGYIDQNSELYVPSDGKVHVGGSNYNSAPSPFTSNEQLIGKKVAVHDMNAHIMRKELDRPKTAASAIFFRFYLLWQWLL